MEQVYNIGYSMYYKNYYAYYFFDINSYVNSQTSLNHNLKISECIKILRKKYLKVSYP